MIKSKAVKTVLYSRSWLAGMSEDDILFVDFDSLDAYNISVFIFYCIFYELIRT